MNFLANENIPLDAVFLLRRAGHQVVSVSEYRPGIKDFDPVSPEEPAMLLINIMKQKDINSSGNFTVIEEDRIRQRVL